MKGGIAPRSVGKGAATKQLEAETRAMEIRLRGLKEERERLLSKIQNDP